ncbi:hypothetical protein EON80_22355 [bacterium]|nr:MAG: hypothetical protein EON80_22355 [bacterium]
MKTCPKCQSDMEAGYIREDFSNERHPWISGVPANSWLGRTIAKSSRVIPMTAYRCTKCGFVEFYAQD